MTAKRAFLMERVKGLGTVERAGFALGAGAVAALVAGGAKAHPIVVALAGIVGAYLAHSALEEIIKESPQAATLLELLAVFL
jgi:hypothetical protein